MDGPQQGDERGHKWKTTDTQAFNSFKEENAQKAKARRLDWDNMVEEDEEGRLVFKKGMQNAIEQDFLDRL